ncbi:MAG: AAA family ATPase [Tepidiformaceae bacterium]
MKIEQLHIDGFGPFANQSFGPFGQPLTVILGSNEAGKSTLLAFIRTILFGFPIRDRTKFYPALNGGRHGGRIVAVADDGVRYTIERTEDASGPSFKLTSDTGLQSTDESMLRPLIGDSSRGVFESVFAFGLADLQDIKRLNESDASAQIYAAGMGATALPKALKRLKDDADKLFGSRLQTQRAAQLVKEIGDLDVKLDAVRGQADEFASLTRRRAGLEMELAAANSKLTTLTGRLAELGDLKQAWTDWLSLNEAQTTLRDVPDQPGFPDDGLARLDRLETAAADAARAHQDAAANYESNFARANASIPSEALLAFSGRIEEIRRGRDSFDASVKDLPKRQTDLAALERELADTMRDLGRGWTEERVLGFDTSIPAHDPIEQWRTRLDEATRTAREAELAHEHANDALREATEAEEMARRALESLPTPATDKSGLEASRGALRASRQALSDYLHASDRRIDAEGRGTQVPIILPPAPLAAPSNLPAHILMGAGALALVGGVALGGTGLVLGVVLGILLLGAGSLMRFTHRATSTAPLAMAAPAVSTTDPHLDELRNNEASSRTNLETVSAPFGPSLPTIIDLDAIEYDLTAIEAALREIDNARKDWRQASQQLDRLSSQAVSAANTLDSATEQLNSIRAAWAEWLTGLGLDCSLLPATVLTLIARMNTARAQLQAIRDPREHPGKIQQDIDRYASVVEQLATQFAIPFEHGRASTIAAAADRLISDYTRANAASISRENLREALEQDAATLESLRRRASEAEGKLAALLALGNAADAEAFRINARAHTARGAAEKQLAEAERRIRAISGPGERYRSFLEILVSTDPTRLELDHSGLSLERESVTAARDALLDERGALANRLELLSNDEATSELLAQRAVLVEQLRECAQRWATLTVARNLLLRAQRKFEEDRQPEVLRRAQEYFRTMTNGRYERLISPLGTQSVTAITAEGISKEPSQLSRGTEDQLYLALRFGLVRQYGARAAHLPVVVDDILVNFDPERALRAARAFAQLSHTNQVIVFTCQPATAQLFRQANPDTQVIDLNSKKAPATLSPVTHPLLFAALPR